MKEQRLPEFLCRAAVFNEVERVVWPPSWLGHTPFALWLMDVLRPATLVELGTHSGNSFASFCQAAKSIGYIPKCFAIDTWQGDPHAGAYSEDVFIDLQNFITSRYAGFATLIRSTFEDAVATFADGSIDLLNIDGYHTYEATKSNFESWLPKLSNKGVILIHDINVHQGDFGAWKYWEEIKAQFKTFSFLHSHGLGVVFVGEISCPDLQALSDANQSEIASGEIRNFFSSLGNVPILRSTNIKLESDARLHAPILEEHQRLSDELITKKNELTACASVLESARSQNKAFEDNLRLQADKINRLLAELEAQGSLLEEAMRWKVLLQQHVDPSLEWVTRILPEICGQHEENRSYKALVHQRLGLSVDQATQNINILYAHLEAMRSPTHRAISFVGRKVRRFILFRMAKKLLFFLSAVKQA